MSADTRELQLQAEVALRQATEKALADIAAQRDTARAEVERLKARVAELEPAHIEANREWGQWQKRAAKAEAKLAEEIRFRRDTEDTLKAELSKVEAKLAAAEAESALNLRRADEMALHAQRAEMRAYQAQAESARMREGLEQARLDSSRLGAGVVAPEMAARQAAESVSRVLAAPSPQSTESPLSVAIGGAADGDVSSSGRTPGTPRLATAESENAGSSPAMSAGKGEPSPQSTQCAYCDGSGLSRGFSGSWRPECLKCRGTGVAPQSTEVKCDCCTTEKQFMAKHIDPDTGLFYP